MVCIACLPMSKEKYDIALCFTAPLDGENRMQKIAQSLQTMGLKVLLVGRTPRTAAFRCTVPSVAIRCRSKRGALFYAEYNLRLFFTLLRLRVRQAIVAVDPDTLLAALLGALLKRCKLVYDAHESFVDVPELHHRPIVRRIWQAIECIGVRYASCHLTVNDSIAALLEKRYGRPFAVLYNYPRVEVKPELRPPHDPLRLYYQGALNAGRGLELLIRAMTGMHSAELHIIGDGYLRGELEQLAEELRLYHRVQFHGHLSGKKLYDTIAQMDIAFNLLDARSGNYYYSSANKFYDAVSVGTPIITMNFPEYREHMRAFEVGILLDAMTESAVIEAIQRMRNPEVYQYYRRNCIEAARHWHWDRQFDTLRTWFKCIQNG